MFNFNEKIIFKKFLLDNTYFFLLASICLTLIVWVIQAVNFLDFVSEDGHSYKVYFYYTILNLPRIFSKIMPVIFFFSLFYTINKYEENNELKIFWIMGITKIKFINVLIKYTFLFFFIQVLLGAFLTPASQNKARSYIKNSNIDYFPSLLKEKKFIDTVDKLTIFIDKKNNNGSFNNVYLKDQIAEDKSKIIIAKSGRLIESLGIRSLELYDGIYININDNKTTIFNFDKTNFNLSKFGTKSVTYRKIQERDSISLLSCLSDFIDHENFIPIPGICDESFINEIKQEFFKRFIKPLYLFSIVLIVSFLLINFKENFIFKSIKSIVFLSSMVGLVVSEISANYFAKNSFYSLTIGFIPVITFLILYLFLIRRFSFNRTKS